jgi:signal transduction histidine kinase
MGQFLVEKLHERGASEAADVGRMVALVRSAVEQTRQMAKGLLLAEIDPESLPEALREFCAAVAAQFRVDCLFNSEGNALLTQSGVATHLYRIAQEAVHNAIRHARAQHIAVDLFVVDCRLVLTIRDDGTGLPAPDRRGRGFGLRIMAHRAGMIGAAFAVEAPPEGGTIVVCNLQLSAHE